MYGSNGRSRSRKRKFKLQLHDWSAGDNDEENAVNGGLESVVEGVTFRRREQAGTTTRSSILRNFTESVMFVRCLRACQDQSDVGLNTYIKYLPEYKLHRSISRTLQTGMLNSKIYNYWNISRTAACPVPRCS